MDINKLIQDFDFGNEQHIVEIMTLKATFSSKTKEIKLLDNHILSLLKTGIWKWTWWDCYERW